MSNLSGAEKIQSLTLHAHKCLPRLLFFCMWAPCMKQQSTFLMLSPVGSENCAGFNHLIAWPLWLMSEHLSGDSPRDALQDCGYTQRWCYTNIPKNTDFHIETVYWGLLTFLTVHINVVWYCRIVMLEICHSSYGDFLLADSLTLSNAIQP